MAESETNVPSQSGVNFQPAEQVDVGREVIEVTVAYLPASSPFHRKYEDESTVGTVRTDAMAFFGVTDHQDRDTHQFFLEFNGQRLTNMGETLEQLVGPDRKGGHFNLVEQITPGGTL